MEKKNLIKKWFISQIFEKIIERIIVYIENSKIVHVYPAPPSIRNPCSAKVPMEEITEEVKEKILIQSTFPIINHDMLLITSNYNLINGCQKYTMNLSITIF